MRNEVFDTGIGSSDSFAGEADIRDAAAAPVTDAGVICSDALSGPGEGNERTRSPRNWSRNTNSSMVANILEKAMLPTLVSTTSRGSTMQGCSDDDLFFA